MVGPSSGSSWQCNTIVYTCLGPLVQHAVSSSGVVVTYTLERLLFLDFKLGLAVTEINTKEVQKQKIKDIKSVKRCRDGMPKSMQTRQG